MKFILNLVISVAAVYITSYLLRSRGVVIDEPVTYLIVAVVLGIVNAIIAPIIKLFSLPITLMTFGLFALVINACMVILASWLVDGFDIGGFVNAFIFSIILSLVSWFFKKLA